MIVWKVTKLIVVTKGLFTIAYSAKSARSAPVESEYMSFTLSFDWTLRNLLGCRRQVNAAWSMYLVSMIHVVRYL